MNKPEVTEFKCEFCHRSFKKSSTLTTHICEYKHRYLDRDNKSNQIGYQAWMQFYKKASPLKKTTTYLDFIKSPYYIAFVKFGSYVTDIKAINVNFYIDYLLKEQVKLDNWTHDSVYDKFIVQYLQIENFLDAITRSVESLMPFSEKDRILVNDYLRYGAVNKICHLITLGKISPWVLYHSKSGQNFLEKLSADQEKLVSNYINPKVWSVIFDKNREEVENAKVLLKQAGF